MVVVIVGPSGADGEDWCWQVRRNWRLVQSFNINLSLVDELGLSGEVVHPGEGGMSGGQLDGLPGSGDSSGGGGGDDSTVGGGGKASEGSRGDDELGGPLLDGNGLVGSGV